MARPIRRGMKCLLVQPKFGTFSFCNYTEVCNLVGAKYPAAPLGLMTVAALLPQYWEFKLIDENVEPLLDEHLEWADIVCTGGMLPQQRGILSIIEKAHEKGKSVAVGGPDPSSQPNLYQTADYLVLGEGEITIPMFIQDLEKGTTSGAYKSTQMADMTKSPIPRFDLIRFRDYLQIGIQYSRGCPFTCEFCDVIELYGRIPRTKTPDQVLAELNTLYALGYRGYIDFVDDNFIGNKKNVKAVLPVMKEWGENRSFPFYFSTQASLNLAADEGLMEMMRELDFRIVFMGIETPEDDILKLTRKYQNVNRPVIDATKKIYSYGMVVVAGFIMGFDNENERSAQSMIDCIQSSGIGIAMVGLLFALPNTQLTRRLGREGRLFAQEVVQTGGSTEFDQTTSGLNFVTRRPRRDILRDYVKVLENIYQPENYFRRITHTALHLKIAHKHRAGFEEVVRTAKAFVKLCAKIGLNKKIGPLFWRMIFSVFIGNRRAMKAAIFLAAMFIHLHKQSNFIIELTEEKVKFIEKYGEREYERSMPLVTEAEKVAV